jgi:hypothetical protein
MVAKITLEPVTFKFHGPPKKLIFSDNNSEAWDTKMGHIDWNTFLVLCNKLRERLEMISSLILSGLVNVTSHLVSVQSLKYIMALAHHYVQEEKIVRSVIG